MKVNGFIIYRGPSLLNGAPIVAVALTHSQNEKTGDVVQVYILADHGERPVDASQDGSDESICGNCKHRPTLAGTCYVVVRRGPTRVWMSLTDGRYPDLSHCVDLAGELLAGRRARLGAYGDPAAVPTAVWRELTAQLAGWVGYTHQWHRSESQPLRDFCMASVDSPAELGRARSMGWRTFRVRTPDEPLWGEGVCPASDEGGYKLTCSTCGFCNGAASGRRGGVAIVLHGNHMRGREERFRQAREGLAA